MLSRTANRAAAQRAKTMPRSAQMARTVALGCERHAAGDDREAAEDEQRLDGLAEEGEGDREGEQRRDAGCNRRPRGADLAHRRREEELRDAGGEQAGEPEPPGARDVVAHAPPPRARARTRATASRAPRRPRPAVPEPDADRDRHRAEGRGRGEREENCGHRDLPAAVMPSAARGRAGRARRRPRARRGRSRT